MNDGEDKARRRRQSERGTHLVDQDRLDLGDDPRMALEELQSASELQLAASPKSPEHVKEALPADEKVVKVEGVVLRKCLLVRPVARKHAKA